MRLVAATADGLIRSEVFRGLRLPVNALLNEEVATVLAGVQKGVKTREHAAFVERLKSPMGSGEEAIARLLRPTCSDHPEGHQLPPTIDLVDRAVAERYDE